MKPKVSNLAAKSVSILRTAKTIVLQACDVGNTSEDMSVMAAKGSVRPRQLIALLETQI